VAELRDSKGQPFWVDDEDADRVSARRWSTDRDYIVSGRVRLARFVLDAPAGLEVDHVNGNKRDNKKSNLRLATKAENQRNKGKYKSNTTGFKGVSFDKSSGKFEARFKVNGRQYFAGRYATAEEASVAVSHAREIAHGDFARDSW
jgi:hypothetical protein